VPSILLRIPALILVLLSLFLPAIVLVIYDA
jgi:hypothetical protein